MGEKGRGRGRGRGREREREREREKGEGGREGEKDLEVYVRYDQIFFDVHQSLHTHGTKL